MITLALVTKRIGELEQLYADAKATADRYLGAIEEMQKVASFLERGEASTNEPREAIESPSDIVHSDVFIKPTEADRK